MRRLISAAAVAIAVALGLGGCALAPLVGLQDEVNFVEGKGLEGVATAIDVYCATETLNIEQRRQRLAKLNALTVLGDMTPLDCNGDGRPDFDTAPAPELRSELVLGAKVRRRPG